MLTHMAIIPDGNRHWAIEQGLPAIAGYPQAIKIIENCCSWAIDHNIPYLSFYCFSTENFDKRPQHEIDNFIQLAINYAFEGVDYYVNMGIKVIFNGQRDRLPQNIISAVESVENKTKDGTRLTLILYIDYSGKTEIIEAINKGIKTKQEMDAYMNRFAPDPDVIIRTNNAKRLSNFMLWQASYAELFFLPMYFPDLKDNDLNEVLEEFNHRARRYGG